MHLLSFPVGYGTVHGTWSREQDIAGGKFHQIGSNYWRMMRQHGFRQVRQSDPYRWSGRINGAAGVLHRIIGKPPADKVDWECAADAWRWWVDPIPWEDRNFIVHSHGLWPVILGCAYDPDPTIIRTLISVGSPERDDMREFSAKAIQRIGFWLHLYDAKFDRMGSWGAFGDGSFDWWWNPKSRAHPSADLNIPVAGIGHSGLLHEESLLPLWGERGWLDYIVVGHAEGHTWRNLDPTAAALHL